MLMVCIKNNITFYNLLSRTSQLIIEKNNLNVTLGFILNDLNKNIKFVVDKGFNFLEPNKN